jgi:hypothetical protein
MQKLGINRVEVLIINTRHCPYEVTERLHELDVHDGHRPSFRLYISELSPYGDEDWSRISMENIKFYWENQCARLGEYKYNGTLEEFIKDYGLTIDKWLIDSGIDLTGIKHIFFTY